MHEDFDTEGFIPSSIGAGVPDIPEYGRLSGGPRKGRTASARAWSPSLGEGHEVSSANGRRRAV